MTTPSSGLRLAPVVAAIRPVKVVVRSKVAAHLIAASVISVTVVPVIKVPVIGGILRAGLIIHAAVEVLGHRQVGPQNRQRLLDIEFDVGMSIEVLAGLFEEIEGLLMVANLVAQIRFIKSPAR